MTRASGTIPQISIVIGPAAGGAAYGPALTDIVILGPDGRVFVTGPDVVRSVTGENVDALRLGGPEPHGRRSGVVHVLEHSFAMGIACGRLSIPTSPTSGNRGRIPCCAAAPSGWPLHPSRAFPAAPARHAR